jgi:hypothetical protein
MADTSFLNATHVIYCARRLYPIPTGRMLALHLIPLNAYDNTMGSSRKVLFGHPGSDHG